MMGCMEKHINHEKLRNTNKQPTLMSHFWFTWTWSQSCSKDQSYPAKVWMGAIQKCCKFQIRLTKIRWCNLMGTAPPPNTSASQRQHPYSPPPATAQAHTITRKQVSTAPNGFKHQRCNWSWGVHGFQCLWSQAFGALECVKTRRRRAIKWMVLLGPDLSVEPNGLL